MASRKKWKLRFYNRTAKIRLGSKREAFEYHAHVNCVQRLSKICRERVLEKEVRTQAVS